MHRYRIDYSHHILRIKTGVLTSKNVIKRLSIRLGEYSENYLTTVACIDKLKIAWKEYQVAKKDAAALRSAFIEDQIAKKAHHKRMSSEAMIKMLRKEQRQIQEGRDSRQIRGRNNKQPVLKAEITDFIKGSVRTIYTQEEIVTAAAESNLRRQSQTVDTAFRQPPLMNDFGPCADNEENCLGVLDGTFVPHPDADPCAVSLLETMVQPQSLRNKGPICCIPCPKESAEAWHRQKDIT